LLTLSQLKRQNMGLISFFRTPEHRVFHYTPRYYDEKKEHLQELYKKYGKDKNGKPIEGIAQNEDPSAAREIEEAEKKSEYVPGASIRGSFSRGHEEHLKQAGNQGVKRVITLVTLVIILVAVYFLAEGLAKIL